VFVVGFSKKHYIYLEVDTNILLLEYMY